MQKLNKLSKIILTISVLFFSFWVGGYLLRQMVIYQLFEPENLALRSIYNTQNLHDVFLTILPLFVFNIATYLGFIITLILFLFVSKISLKKEGWLFISVLIIGIFAPFEVFLIIKDYKIARLIYSGIFDSNNVLILIKERLTIFSSFSLIELFSFIGVVFLCIFQPFRKS
jgi:hypothetical protein